MKLIDLSVIIENTPSEPMKIKHKRISHKKGAKLIAWRAHLKREKNIFKKAAAFLKILIGKRKISAKDFPQSMFITQDKVTLSTHMGTHIDSPYHFGPLCEGKPAKTIDQLPLDLFYGDGICLDLRHIKPGKAITAKDIKEALAKINYQLKEKDIVLIWTGTAEKWGSKEYFTQACGMSEEATAYLVNNGVKLIGIDAYSFDLPFPIMLNRFMETKEENLLWPAHFYGRKKEYVHIERLKNLGALPSTGFKLCCFPIPIKGADASWSRVVAIVN